ncbi:hypothetical protein [Microbacterium sp.]|uniref:hypothetical protein n=1 Tax=Microbacterium sp. TaxID=51671 RepID=UPI003F9A8C9A
MNTEVLLRKTVHPPCIEEETLEITVPADRAALAFTDRLSLRIGLWLLLRAERAQRSPRGKPAMSREEAMRLLETRRITEREAMVMLTYDLQRQLL